MWTVEIDDAAIREIKSMSADLQAELLQAFVNLELNGPFDLPYHMAKKIDGKLWELRVKTADGIARAFYFTVNPKRAIVVSAFVKKSQKLPERELKKAISRMKTLLGNAEISQKQENWKEKFK